MSEEKEEGVVYGSSYHPYGDPVVSSYWKKKYEDDAEVYWDRFYKKNEDNFFKDRHYLEREFPELEEEDHVILEIGCGVGNSTIPLLEINPRLNFYSFDFSKKAISILIERARSSGFESQCEIFYWDPACMESPETYPHKGHSSKLPSKDLCDLGLVVFVLSAIAPEKMMLVLQRTAMYIKPGGTILVRDYAEDDMAHKRFKKKQDKSKLEENFYVRGDGTRAFYFTEEFMQTLAKDSGVCHSVDIHFVEKDVCNRGMQITMPRKFIQAKFNIK